MLCSHDQAHLYVTYTHVTNSTVMITAHDYINRQGSPKETNSTQQPTH